MGAPEDAGPEGYQLLVSAAAYCRWEGWNAATVAGDDRTTFLQNFCTNDLRRVRPGDGCEAFLTSVQGKVLAHLVVLASEDRLIALVGPGQVERVVSHLDRYIIRERVELSSDDGDANWMLLSRAAAENLAESATSLAAPWSHLRVAAPHGELRLVRSGMTSVNSYLLRVESKDVAAFEKRLADAGAVAVDHAAWHALRIEAGWPLWGVDFDDDNLPQEIGRDSEAISFTKGCYLGQETVARIDALGHVNQRLSTVRFAGSLVPSAGLELKAVGATVGRVSSASWSPRLGAPIALAMIRRGHHEIGMTVESQFGAAEVIATPATLAVEKD